MDEDKTRTPTGDEAQTLKLGDAVLTAANGGIDVRFTDGEHPSWYIAGSDVDRLFEFLKQHVKEPAGVG